MRLDSAKTLGLSLVLLDYKNNSNQILPKGFFDELIHFNEGALNTEWLVFTSDFKSKNIDKVLVININNINIFSTFCAIFYKEIYVHTFYLFLQFRLFIKFVCKVIFVVV